MEKEWWKSSTIWVNVLATVAFGVQQFTGYVITPEMQGMILTVLNLILRFKTSSGIVIKKN